MHQPKVGEIYRHANGKDFEVIAIARDDDKKQDLVIHRGLHDGRTWSRLVENFVGEHSHGRKRFVRIVD